MSGFLLKSGATVRPIKDNEERGAAVAISGKRKPVPDETPAAPPRKSWLLLCKENKETCMQAGENLKKICGCCLHKKIRPQEHISQEVLEISTIKSSSLTFPSSSCMDSCSNTVSVKEEGNLLVDESFDTILEQIKHGEKRYQEKILNISVLSSVSALCREAEESGLGESHLPHSKANLAEHIMKLMADLPEQSVPDTTLICAMYAIHNLSKIKPPLPPDMESGVLRFALQGVLSLDIEDATSHSQALYKASSDALQAMLRRLLEEEPTAGHLLLILEHINFWIKSRDPKKRARAQKVSTDLLQYAVLSIHFDDSDNLPLLGRHVAERALCLMDSIQEVSEQAREGIMWLYNMLLHQNELVFEMPWCQQEQNHKEMQGYTDASTVGQMFAKLFNEQQRRSFLQTSLLAIYDPLPNIREAAVFLIYSLLGREKELLGKEVKEVKTKIMKEILKLETCMSVTDLLENLYPSQDQLILEDTESIEDIENTEEEL